MTDATPWSQRVPLERIGPVAQPLRLEAPQAARMALAERFDLGSIASLTAEVEIGREYAGGYQGVRLKGSLRAAFHYACRVSREPFPATLALPVDVLFLPPDQLPDPDDVTENPDPWDIDELDPAGVDVAEAVAVTLALSLDPFPRGPSADDALERLGIQTEAQARAARSPFAVLKGSESPDEG
jgi:uncharacterized metal-binding protein YceD (DUF177 family)